MPDLRSRAERLVREPVQMADLALAFDETAASTADVLVGGKSFFPAMLDDIAAATSSVHINQYGFRPGEIGERFASALLAKAAEGLPVRLVVDGSGSYRGRSGRAFYDRLRAGGIEVGVVRATSPRAPSQLGHFDHRKFFVIDGRTCWIGGGGIEDHFEDGRFHDLFLRLTGPVASQLQLVFLASFRWLGGAVPEDQLDALFPPHEDAPGAVPARVLHNAPGRFRPITTRSHEQLDGRAADARHRQPLRHRQRDDRAHRAMPRGAACACGCSCPPTRTTRPARPPSCPTTRPCSAAGVRILGHPAMLHAKAFVRDGEDVLVGTCNLDAWSLKRFFEIDVLVRSPELAARFDERFSVPAEAASTPGRAATGVGERVKGAVFGALSPLL